MCGILGMAFQKEHKMEDAEVHLILKKLLMKSRMRGSAATGVAFVSLTKAVVIKHHIPATTFVETDFYKNAVLKYLDFSGKPSKTGFNTPLMVIGHTRAETKGTYLDRNNNHPIIAKQVVGVHNGVIGNDEHLWNLYGKKLTRAGKVDSEIIFRLIEHHANSVGDSMVKAIKATSGMISGSYACAAVNLKMPWVLWLFKGYGTAFVYHYPNKGLILFASENRFIQDTVANMKLGPAIQIPFDSFEGLGINLEQNRQAKFELPDDKTAGLDYCHS